MNKPTVSEKFLLSFVPEQWNAVTKFGKFKYPPLHDDWLFKRGIKTTIDHLDKFIVLIEVAKELSDGFEIDHSELDEKGYSPAINSKKFSAVAECCINELYAALDGIKDVIYAVYSSVQGVQKKSTSKLFSKAKDGGYDEGFPEELKNMLIKAYDNWFLLLRKYRTELTHGSLGTCHQDRETKKIRYMHQGLGANGRGLIIEDLDKYITDIYQNVIQLQDEVFEYLYRELPLESTDMLCGFYDSRRYMRNVEPKETLTVQSGICKSVHYPDPCPLRNDCEAYKRATIVT